eukprot:1586877-Prymnesium_polylepis.3
MVWSIPGHCAHLVQRPQESVPETCACVWCTAILRTGSETAEDGGWLLRSYEASRCVVLDVKFRDLLRQFLAERGITHSSTRRPCEFGRHVLGDSRRSG